MMFSKTTVIDRLIKGRAFNEYWSMTESCLCVCMGVCIIFLYKALKPKEK